jgi:uncharacterized protein (DUF1778 family)
MAVSEAQRRATNKWNKANLEQLAIRIPKGEKDIFKAFAETAGLSLAQFVREACYEKAGQEPPKTE